MDSPAPGLVDRQLARYFRSGRRGFGHIFKFYKAMTGRDRIAVRSSLGNVFQADPYCYVDRFLIRSGFYESEVLLAMLQHAWGAVIWDIGAFHGHVGITLAKRVPDCRVLMFEPDPINRRELQRNNQINGSPATVLPLALSSASSGKQAFYHHRSNRGMSSLSTWAEKNQYEKFEVEVAAGDDLVHAGLAPAPTVIKLDVEGAEWKAVQGLEHCLSSSEFRALVFEAGKRFLDDASEFRHWLRSRAFNVTRLERLEPTSHNLENYLAVGPCALSR